MKHLKQHRFTNKSLITTHNLLVSISVVSGFLMASCTKEPVPKEITVHNGSSIQAAVDAAVNGTIIIIEPGTYKEAVTINKPNITLVGVNLAKTGGVTIENPGSEENGITVNENGDGFTLKNVTVTNFKKNGVILNGVDGFLFSQVAAINNGEYGLFPVHCTNGTIEWCTATGHTDTGIYVGQSTNIQVNQNEAYSNVNGIEIENSSHIVVDRNNSYNNVAGILVDLLPGLQIKKSSDILITNNQITKNNHVNFGVPGEGFESVVPSGSGILVVGADSVTVKGNFIKGNNFVGVAAVSTLILGSLAGLPPSAFADIEPNPDGAKIISNNLVNNGAAPPSGIGLPGVDVLWDGSGTNNCWKYNIFSSTYPSPLPACN